MNTPESICVSLEMAQRLKSAGWPQESIFRWIELSDEQFILWTKSDYEGTMKEDEEFDGIHGWSIFADAPTAEEILRKLPMHSIHGNSKGYIVTVDDLHDEKGRFAHHEQDFSLANAAAAMFLFLSENKFLSDLCILGQIDPLVSPSFTRGSI